MALVTLTVSHHFTFTNQIIKIICSFIQLSIRLGSVPFILHNVKGELKPKGLKAMK